MPRSELTAVPNLDQTSFNTGKIGLRNQEKSCAFRNDVGSRNPVCFDKVKRSP